MGETYLKKCNSVPHSSDGSGPKVAFGVSSVQGWRSTQEDAHLALPQLDANTSMWGVFDGHNGAEVAQLAAKRLPQYILTNKNYKEGRIDVALQESFMTFDSYLISREGLKELITLREAYSKAPLTRTNAPGMTSGTTAIVALIRDNTAYVANLGDSRCILCRSGKAFPLSNDHKPDNESERQRIESAGGEVVYGRINYGVNVSRAFGDHSYKQNPNLSMKQQMVIAFPEITTEKLNPKTDNFMALICDGVWNSVSNEELITYVDKRINKVKRLSKICEEVFNQILPKVMPKRGIIGKDNMTFLIVSFISESPKAKTNSKESVYSSANSNVKNKT